MDKIIAMTTFVQIAESGSLTKAAEVMDKSLPSVVRMLATLEEYLGVRLINRTTRKISLTKDGQHYLERCKRILNEIEDAEKELLAEHDEPIGTIRVTAPVLFGYRHVTPALIHFAQKYERVEMDLVLLNRVVNLVDEGFDVAIRIGELEDSSMIARKVGYVRRIVCASPKYLKEHGTPKLPEEISNYDCIRHTGIASSTHWNFVKNKKQQSVPVHGPMMCNDAAASIDACASGLGIGMFLSYQIAPLIKQKKLKLILTDFEPTPLPVSVVYPQPKFMATRVRVFVDWMTEELRKALNYNTQ